MAKQHPDSFLTEKEFTHLCIITDAILQYGEEDTFDPYDLFKRDEIDDLLACGMLARIGRKLCITDQGKHELTRGNDVSGNQHA